MKRNLFLLAIVAYFGCIIFSSYEHGPAYEGGINRTGSNGGVANCAGGGCHAANTPTTEVAISVYNAAGMPVTQYVPGANYTVAIKGHHTTALTLTEFGFQVSAITGGGMQAGSFAVTSGSGLRVTTLDDLQIVEHKKALDDSITNYFVARFTWTAPASGTGNVQFYGILNPFGGEGEGDDDDDDDDDDRTRLVRYRMDDDEEEEGDTTCPNVAPVLLLTEGNGGPASVASVDADSYVLVYPNPCTHVLNIKMDLAGPYVVNVYGVNGSRIYTANASGHTTVPVAELPNGIYQVELVQHNNRIFKSIVKR